MGSLGPECQAWRLVTLRYLRPPRYVFRIRGRVLPVEPVQKDLSLTGLGQPLTAGNSESGSAACPGRTRAPQPRSLLSADRFR